MCKTEMWIGSKKVFNLCFRDLCAEVRLIYLKVLSKSFLLNFSSVPNIRFSVIALTNVVI